MAFRHKLTLEHITVFGAATSLLLAHHQIPHIALANHQLRTIITDQI
jgi:hypothetical protein